MAYLLYVAVKLMVYIAWCWVGLRLWRLESATFLPAAIFGVIRLIIGVLFGVAIFLSGPIQPEHLLWKYIAIYSPVRIVEWLIMALIIGRKSGKLTPLSSIPWCLGGVVVSFAADLASPEAVSGHFCVGRCLC
jgi:hypothetical protein